MGANISWGVAFLGGLLTFFSPCVLPLLPIYLSYLAGTAGSDTDLRARRKQTMMNAVAFSVGFTVSFVLIGLVFYGVMSQFRVSGWFSKVLGIVLIILGLHTIGVFKIPFLLRDSRKMDSEKLNSFTLGSSFLMGLLFAAGWSPCIGPILATILSLTTAASGSVVGAGLMMLVFSIGLAIPFIIAAFLADKASRWARRNAKFTVWAERATGVLILLIGLALFFFSIHDMSGWAQEHMPWADNMLNIESQLLGEDE